MRIKVGWALRVAAGLCLVAAMGSCVRCQEEADLTAKGRILPSLGPGLRAVKRLGGLTYVLSSPSPGLQVFDAKGKQVLLIAGTAQPAPGSKPVAGDITFGEDCDVDAQGRIYVADRGANLVKVFAGDGKWLRSMAVNAPISVAALPDGEVAVATLRDPHLVIVFDENGRDVREFGDPEQFSDRGDLNRFLNAGQLATDAKGHLYYGFAYAPEPTVRQFDRFGYARGDVQYVGVDAAPEAIAVRKEIQRQEKRGNPPTFKRVLTGVGVDPESGEVWMGVNNVLLHFDKDGNRLASYMLYTPEGAHLDAEAIIIGKQHLVVGSDPLGIYEFDRPDKQKQP